MKRRSFLAGLFAAPMVPVAAKALSEAETVNVDPKPIIEDGTLNLSSANLGEITGGTLQSSNGKILIGFGLGQMTLTV